MFGVGLGTFLLSKEIYVMEHEFYTGISLLIMIVYAVKKFGPPLANYLDKEIEVGHYWYMAAELLVIEVLSGSVLQHYL